MMNVDFALSLVAPVLMTGLALATAFVAGIATAAAEMNVGLRVTSLMISLLFTVLAAALWILLGIRFWGVA